jgi:hypothetical protein
MEPENPESLWKINWLNPPLLWNKQPIRPAEIGAGLCKVMLAPENVLEDANYNKIVPNCYVVELSPSNYRHHYQPLDNNLIQQWRERLADHLMTANSRLGRKEYRFAGQLQIELRSAAEVKDSQARILCRVVPDFEAEHGRVAPKTRDRGKEAAFLETVNGDRRWSLYPGENTIGRGETCDIFLNLPLVQQERLISAQHATIRVERTRCLLFDGTLSGKPSANGTFVNSERISEHGVVLQDGDLIILAALNPRDPRPETPGVAALRFRTAKLDPGRAGPIS